MDNFLQLAKNAKAASLKMANLSNELKNQALNAVADIIDSNHEQIFQANKKDLEMAQKLLNSGEITQATFNRLKLDDNKMRDMVAGIRDMTKLEDPINKKLLERKLDEGLNLYKISCPIGVLGIIFEARPDVISQISALAIKSSNAVILKGGKESKCTNQTILTLINQALDEIADFPKNCLNQVFSREEAAQMLSMNDYIDLIIPRGGNSLVKFIKENTKIPVLGHSDGICHIFIDNSAGFDMARKIVVDAKTQYPSACNAVETVLIHERFPQLEKFKNELKNAQIKIIETPDTWAFEYGEKILALKIVKDVDEAIEHINTYGSGHTDCIVTSNAQNAENFMNSVNSAGVYHNASTRFADGYRYGFGAEVGISTNKTHARGPVGLDGLSIYKYKLIGNGHIVDDYANGRKSFQHIDIL